MRLLPVLVLLALLTACATSAPQVRIQPEPAQELPPAPEIPTEQPPTTTEEPYVTASPEGVTFDGPISSVACDRATRTLTFTAHNPTDFTWHVEKDLPFPQPKGHATVRFSLNGIEVNSGQVRTFNGEQLFGDLPFSSHCDTALVDPDATITCTLAPVPLRDAQGVDAQTNELSIDSQGVYTVVTFLC